MGRVNILFISSVILWFQSNIKPTLARSEQKTKEIYCCLNTIYSSRTRQQIFFNSANTRRTSGRFSGASETAAFKIIHRAHWDEWNSKNNSGWDETCSLWKAGFYSPLLGQERRDEPVWQHNVTEQIQRAENVWNERKQLELKSKVQFKF